MFDNLSISTAIYSSADGTERIRMNLSWDWCYKLGDKFPSCDVFVCTIPESRLLRGSMFGSDEIIKCINREIVDTSSPTTRVTNLQNYHKDPSHHNSCWLNTYSLVNGGMDTHTVTKEFPISDLDKVFFLCVYDSCRFETKVLAPKLPQNSINFDFNDPSFIDKIRGKTEIKLLVGDSGPRRKVLVTKFGNKKVYSLIPQETNCYLNKEIQDKELVDSIVYLSSLVGF